MSSQAGGLVGQNDAGSIITNSYSTGNTSSSAFNSYAGGLVGANNSSGNSSSITNSYSTGNVSSSATNSFTGGLVGRNLNSSITNSYYDRITSGQTNIRGGGSGTLTCIGGFETDPPNPGDPSLSYECIHWHRNHARIMQVLPLIEEPLKPFFNWHEDINSNRYDSNGDGMVDDFCMEFWF